MRSGDHFVGDSPESSVLLFTHGGDGFVLDSHWNQSSRDFGIEALGVHQLVDADKSKGVWLEGRGHASFRDVSIGSFDIGMRLDRSELITIDRLKVASWPTIGRLIPTAGVVFGLVEGMGGGVTNSNRLRTASSMARATASYRRTARGMSSKAATSTRAARCCCTGAQGLVFPLVSRQKADRAGGHPVRHRRRIPWRRSRVLAGALGGGLRHQHRHRASEQAEHERAASERPSGRTANTPASARTRVLGARPDRLGGDLGAMIADQASYVFPDGAVDAAASYSSGDLHDLRGSQSAAQRRSGTNSRTGSRRDWTTGLS